jgi:hypothetical protein
MHVDRSGARCVWPQVGERRTSMHAIVGISIRGITDGAVAGTFSFSPTGVAGGASRSDSKHKYVHAAVCSPGE